MTKRRLKLLALLLVPCAVLAGLLLWAHAPAFQFVLVLLVWITAMCSALVRGATRPRWSLSEDAREFAGRVAVSDSSLARAGAEPAYSKKILGPKDTEPKGGEPVPAASRIRSDPSKAPLPADFLGPG